MANVMKEGRNPAVFVELRKHAAWYTKGMNGATELRRKVNDCRSSEELIKLIKDFQSELNN